MIESVHRRKDGSTFPVEVSATLVHLERDYLIAVARDVTERKRAQEALRHAEERFRNIVENAIEGIFQRTLQGRFLSANPALARMFGYATAAQLVEQVTDTRKQVYVDPERCDELTHLLDKQDYIHGFESQLIHRDGRRIWVSETVRLVRDEHGEPIYHEGFVEEITERRRLEEQFRQAQKMEAIGRLAGGVAHDFNNLLTVISGYSDLMFGRLPVDDPNRELLAEIQRASERATGLTRQLLAFSRKQVLEPQVLNLNTLVNELGNLLRRLIGEDIEFSVVAAPELGFAKVDPGQFEQALMNLAVNARDAMPRGGSLTLETQNVELDPSYAESRSEVQPGNYVLLAVSDTGTGMSEETRSRIFEPFFTTKEPGKGTGLGLSMVFGFVKQSGGHIEVYSELSHGTTFKIYLPRVDEEAPTTHVRQPIEVPTGTETILLVEDEEGVRQLASLVLRANGYTVLEAKDGQDAVWVARQHTGPIDLLLTDVVMPRMSGRQLAALLTADRPDMKRLFMSGYTAEAMDRHGMLGGREGFLQKPFTPLLLSRKVRHLLDMSKDS